MAVSPGRKPEGGSLPTRTPGPGQGGRTRPDKVRAFRQMGELLSIGWGLALSIGIGLGLGILLDRWLGTRPWGTIIFLLLGVASGFINLFRTALRLEKKNGPDRDTNGTDEG